MFAEVQTTYLGSHFVVVTITQILINQVSWGLCAQRLACLLQSDTRRGQGRVEELSLAHDDHAPLARKLEVGGGDARVDLAQELPGVVPDVYAVVGAGVDVAFRVAVDA